MDGRTVINKQVSRNQMVLSSNLKTLAQNLSKLELEANSVLESYSADIQYESDATAALLLVSERLVGADSALVGLLCDIAATKNGPQTSSFLFQPVISSAVDFLYLSSQITRSAGGGSSGGKQRPALSSSHCELVRLYRVSCGKDSSYKYRQMRVFTVMSLDKLDKVLRYGWSHLIDTLIFSTNAGELILFPFSI